MIQHNFFLGFKISFVSIHCLSLKIMLGRNNEELNWWYVSPDTLWERSWSYEFITCRTWMGHVVHRVYLGGDPLE
jgi:hypothetical protein